MRFCNLLGTILLLMCAATCAAATYYVDFENGADGNPGTASEAAWKHAPGDSAATDHAKAVKLQPGDVVKFKGGVVYRGSIGISPSGRPGQPIVYDGNSAGDWGQGKAVIDGSVPLEALTPCATPEAAWGNPNFKNIYWTTVPKGAKWQEINLYQGLKPLAWSQHPNPADPLFQENPRDYFKARPGQPRSPATLQVRPVGMGGNAKRPLMAMFDNSRLSAVIEKMNGGAVEAVFDKPVTVTEFSVTPQPKYVNPKQMSFSGDGKLLLKVELEHNPGKTVEQRFKLPSPATFTKLTVTFDAAHPMADGTVREWGAVQAIRGYDAQGKNVLQGERSTFLRDEKAFVQDDPAYYDNAIVALHGQPNAIFYKRILAYDPQRHEVRTETLGHNQTPYEKTGSFSLVNSPRFIDIPGEYALILDPEADGSHKLFLWPPDGTPEGLTRGEHGLGVSIRGSHVIVQGFWIRKQGWNGSTGISGRGKGSGVVIRDCKISNLRGSGAGITTTQIDDLLVDHCEIADNAGHTKGIVLRNASNVVTRRCTLRRNSATALDYYTVVNGVVQDCQVLENPGMHANGLTFYVGCKNILVERNVVREGNVALTVQDGEGMIIRNNILEGGPGGSPAIGLWSGKPYNNIVIANNVLRWHGDESHAAAVYGGNSSAKGYAIVNNIIDGLSGNVLAKADFHHNIFTKYGPVLPPQRLGNNQYVPEWEKLVVDAGANDYRPKAGGPAVDAGVALAGITAHDAAGRARPIGRGVDIGPYELPVGEATAAQPQLADPGTFRFTLDGYQFVEPAPYVAIYQPRFRQRDGETVTLKGVDRTGEGGGKVNLRANRGGYISGWDQDGHWLEWTVEAPAPGAYELAIEHASETPATRRVLLNGDALAGLEAVPFTATGGWTTFEKTGLPKPLTLKAGKNVIRFVNVTGSLNFKTLAFIPVEAK